MIPRDLSFGRNRAGRCPYFGPTSATGDCDAPQVRPHLRIFFAHDSVRERRLCSGGQVLVPTRTHPPTNRRAILQSAIVLIVTALTVTHAAAQFLSADNLHAWCKS